MPKSPIGIGVNISGFKLGLRGYSPTKWFLSVSLDIPMGLDVTKKIQLNLN